MGGCCCYSSRRSEAVRAPVDIYRQQNLEEHGPLSSAFNGSSPTSVIVAVDRNLDTSTPDTYRAPPTPLPYDVVLTVPDNPDWEKSDVKSKINDQQESINDLESLKVDESCKKGVLEEKADEEDVCPICLEENAGELHFFNIKEKSVSPLYD